jgi:hypothetical protein
LVKKRRRIFRAEGAVAFIGETYSYVIRYIEKVATSITANLTTIGADVVANLVAARRMKSGIPTPLRSEDRRILEQFILPYFAENGSFYRILFVGCEYYTWHYRKIFETKEYWTIEPRTNKAIFGAERHIIGYMGQVDTYFEKGSLDAIICNGVLGWGLNNPEETEDSFEKCFSCLREGGILVLGWNDLKGLLFPRPPSIRSLQQFRPFVFPPLGTSEYQTNTYGHTYNFYIKPASHP